MDIKQALNEKQQQAVHHTNGPLLILAGAGSGKTKVLTHRIAYLIEECGVNPWNILAITFTNKAANEMRERVDKLVGSGSESIWVSTFHAACVRILRRYIDRIGYENSFTIYDTDDQKTLMKEVCKILDIDSKKFKERSFLSAISTAKNEMLTPDEYEKAVLGDYVGGKVAEVYHEYNKQLSKNNALDFDDLLFKTVQLFEKEPEVLNNYQERFKYIMVDEYQDTNYVQFRLVSLLAGKYKNLCVVGDDDQSIYKFRGADIKNILNFEKIFPDALVIKLEQNYRSTQTVLDAANAVIRNNFGRKDKSLWTSNPQGERVSFNFLDTGYEEAEYVANVIINNVATGGSYNEHAILYRTNAQSRLFEEQFVAANIPYKIVGGVNFYARKEIKDLLAYLKTIDTARDDLAVRRIINVPKRGIGLTTVNKIQESATAREINFYEALQGLDLIPGMVRSEAKIHTFVSMIEYFRSLITKMSLAQLLDEVIKTTGYMEEINKEDEQVAKTRSENIAELLSKAASYEESCRANGEEVTLGGFLAEVALVADIDTLDESQGYVVLMTLHGAKGLEFPNVYMAGMEEGLFPSSMNSTGYDLDELEEERRLCYVGITRAKKKLFLTCAGRRMIRGDMHSLRPSRFVEEIPKELLEFTEVQVRPSKVE
jgi:DNA helicase-2/ATP-dependent DNA helicase PcrA